MGLDMYLTKRIYIGAEYEYRNVKGIIELTKGEDDKPIKIDLSKVSYVEERAGYWRKANQIHAWFVKNVQDGVDNCGEYRVSENQLQHLLADCKKVKEDSKSAELVLPTQSGFFFGSTEYDEYYMQDIDHTIEVIEPLLKEMKESDFEADIYYSSSW